MRCSDVKSDLPLYSDDILSVAERADLDAHLDTCPLCRQALSEYQEVKNGLRSLARPVMPEAFLASLRSTVAANLAAPAIRTPVFHVIEDRRNWFDTWMMPSAVGTFASLVFGMFILWGILSSARDPRDFISISTQPKPVMLASSNPMIGDDSIDILAADYATTRLSIAGESPSINPQGALVALTKSLVRGEMKDDEVVVVAEVFGNGLARISEVVEPSANSRAIEDLEKALESDPVYAPFVPASFDGRSDRMRVVLKIQNVNVHTNYSTPSRNLTDRRGT